MLEGTDVPSAYRDLACSTIHDLRGLAYNLASRRQLCDGPVMVGFAFKLSRTYVFLSLENTHNDTRSIQSYLVLESLASSPNLLS